MIKIKDLKSVSPLIATILLIVIVVILVVAILTWGKDFVGESLEDTKSFLEESISLRGFITSQGNINNFITIANNHSRESISIVGYRIITSTDHQYFYLLNNDYYLEEKITINPKRSSTIKVHCLPESMFNLDLLLEDNSFVRVNVSVRNYSLEMCSIYDGLIAAYDMKTIEGDTLIDVSGNGVDGVLVGASLTNEGVYFDGNSNYINFGSQANQLQVENKITFLTKVKLNSTRRSCSNCFNNVIRSGGLGYELQERSDGYWRWYVSVNSQFNNICWTNHEIILNRWYVVVGTYNSETGSQKLYVDGLLRGQINRGEGNVITHSLFNPKLGSHSTGTQRYLHGTIQKTLIFDRELSEQEINHYYYLLIEP